MQSYSGFVEDTAFVAPSGAHRLLPHHGFQQRGHHRGRRKRGARFDAQIPRYELGAGTTADGWTGTGERCSRKQLYGQPWPPLSPQYWIVSSMRATLPAAKPPGPTLPTPTAASPSRRAAINGNGAVVGEVTIETQPVAFVWTAADGLTNQGPFQGMRLAVATDLNNTGWIVGFTEGATGGSHAMLWKVK